MKLRPCSILRAGLLALLLAATASHASAAGPATAPVTTPLADAAERSDWPGVRALLDQHADPNAAQVDGTTALHWAARNDDADTVKRLLAAGADARSANRYGVTPLSQACVNGNGPIVSALLDAGADPNGALRGGETALMTSARTGRVEPVRALLEAGAKVEASDRKGQTGLMWAAAEGNVEVVESLIAAGADVHARVKSGFTPMLFAVREGRADVVRAFLKAGVDVNEALQPESKGGGNKSGSATSALLLATVNGHFDLALELLNAGANANDERSGFTALHALTWVRKPNRGDDIDSLPPPIGSGHLTHLQFARELVKHGANVNARLKKGPPRGPRLDLTGATPFLMAAKTADLPYMKLLVELGADPLLPNKDGCTPLMAAAGVGSQAPTEEAGTEDEALAAAEYLLALGADVNTVDRNAETAMHGAAYRDFPKMVQYLADHGAKVELWNRKNRIGSTPLMIAQGIRPGTFEPSAETAKAIDRVMRAAGVIPPPPPTSRPATRPLGY